MGFIDKMQRSRAILAGPPRDPVLAEWFGTGSTSSTGSIVTPDTAMRVTAVFRCVSLLSQTYASLPISVDRIIENKGQEPDPNHPLYDVLVYQPNKWQTSFEWREMMAAHFALRGKCYSEIISTRGKSVAELVPLHPDRVQPYRAPDGKLAFYYQPENGPARTILQDEMHFMHLLSMDGTRPVSPIGLNREAVGLSMATEEHGARLFSNGAKPGGIIKMAGRFKDDAARAKFRKSWEQHQGGLENAHRVAVLEDGLEWQQIGLSSEDSQFIETRKLQLSEIGRIFGVPAHKFGDLDRSTNNNIEHQGIEFVTDTIRPGCVRWEQAIQRDLFYGKRTHKAELDLDGLMRGDSEARAKFYASGLQNGYLNRNQVRVKEGYNRSNAEEMNQYTVQSNMIKISDLGKIVPDQSKNNEDEEKSMNRAQRRALKKGKKNAS